MVVGVAELTAGGALVVDVRDDEGGCVEGGPCVEVVYVGDMGVVVVTGEVKVDTGGCCRGDEAPS